MNRKYFGKSWSFSSYKIENGSKQIGLALWWNASRTGFQINVGVLEIQIMREI